MIDPDRRRFQRMKLGKPLLAMMDDQNALILDIGLAGAFVEHYGSAMTGDRHDLTFRWKGEEVSFASEVRRTNVIRSAEGSGTTVSHSGFQFIKPHGDSAARLEDMMATFVGRILAAQKANASADAAQSGSMLFQMGDARRSRTRGFVTYAWDGKSWTRSHTQSPAQPRDGFTVAAYEDEEDLETLCRAWEAADQDGRTMIRLAAELSVNSTKTKK
ncbi:MAG: hypothetical protein NVSMB68_14980 [Thermoanaerobaculia bacterium]